MLMEGFQWELLHWKDSLRDKKLVSVYFGGGTPFLLGPERIQVLLNSIQEIIPYDPATVEVTLEANPENITATLMQAYASAGINRLSIGVQTLDDSLLQTLGRLHNSQKSLDAIAISSQSGISNISIDLMYDLPGQTLGSWKNTLDKTKDLPITHLSLYNLTIEPHTAFFKYKKELLPLLPDETTSLQMFELAQNTLNDAGLKQYEISAFARSNLHSNHNVGYWTGRPFLGLGPSAFSYWNKKRFRNIANIHRYHQSLKNTTLAIDFSEELPLPEQQKELLAIQLRLLSGLNLQEFQQKNHSLPHDTLSTLEQLSQQGLISFENNHVALTQKGILFYDSIASEIV